MIKLCVHQLSMAYIFIHIYIQFYENWLTYMLIMAKLQILNKFKSKNSRVNNAFLITLYAYHHVMVIHIQFKFHEILFIS